MLATARGQDNEDEILRNITRRITEITRQRLELISRSWP